MTEQQILEEIAHSRGKWIVEDDYWETIRLKEGLFDVNIIHNDDHTINFDVYPMIWNNDSLLYETDSSNGSIFSFTRTLRSLQYKNKATLWEYAQNA